MNSLRTILLAFFFISFSSFFPGGSSFEEQQKNFQRVSDVYERKEELFKMRCRSHEVPESFSNMFIRVFKMEGMVEVWAQNNYGKYVKFNEYRIYSISGNLGPKRQLGDCQVPEGFYYINEFNPVSNYHLSLGINYPNESDMKLSKAIKKGGSIFLHGGKTSAGCIAMSDYYIEDVYLAAVKAKNQGQQKIPVQIFPFKMTKQNMAYYTHFPQFKTHIEFWNNLQGAFLFFEKNNRIQDVSVGADGYYKFYDPASAQAFE